MGAGIRMRGVFVLLLGVGCGPKALTDDGGIGEEGDSRTNDGGITGAGPGSANPTTSEEGGRDEGEAEATGLPDPMPDSTSGGQCPVWVHQGCPLEQAVMTSLVHGSTPLGEFDVVPYAFFSSNTWCDWCVDWVNIQRIVFVSDPELLKDVWAWEAPEEGLELRLLGFEGPTGQELTGELVAYRDGESSQIDATFVISNFPEPTDVADPFDPEKSFPLSGEIVTASGNGWAVNGSFTALYCPQLNEYAICE
jgi:hypothetical protein